jgi:hypothetical protein
MSTEPSSPTRAELARELLRYKMEEYSQNGFCASWMLDLEFELWNEADRSESLPKREYIHSTSRECRTLAEIAGGWWAWDSKNPCADNPVFIPMERWLEIIAEHNKNSQTE